MSRIATKNWCNTLAGESIFDPNNDLHQCPTKKQIDGVSKLMVKTTGTIWDSWATLVSGYTDNRLVRRDDIGHKVNCTYYKGVSGECNIYFCQNGFTETNGTVPESAKTLFITPFTGTSDNTNHTTLLGFSNDFFSKLGGSEWQNARIVADMSDSTNDVVQYIINDIPGSKSSDGSYFSWTNGETLQIFSKLKGNQLSIYVSDKSTSDTLIPDVPAGDLEILNGSSKVIKFTYNTYETNASGETVLVESVTVSPTWTTSDSSLATASVDGIIANSNDKQGLVTMTATYAGISLSWNVQVYKYKFSLSLDKSSTEIFVDNTASFKAFYNKHKVTLTGTDGDIVDTTNITSSCNWESSNTSVATVSKGVVSGKSSGTITITAKYPASNPTHSATATVTVKSRGKVSFETTYFSTNFMNKGFSKSQYEGNLYISTFETWVASMCDITGYSYSYQNSGSVDILFEITKSSDWQSGYYYMLQATNTATYLSEVYISSDDAIKLNNGTNVTLTPRELTLSHATDPAFKILQSIEINKGYYNSYNGSTSPVIVSAKYDDNSIVDVTSLCTVTITDQSVVGTATWDSDDFCIQHGSTGTAKINVSYTENGITKTVSAPITTRPIQPQSIVFDPSTITINVGESKTVFVYGLLENGTQTTTNLEFSYVNNIDDYMDYTVKKVITVDGKPVIPLTITGKAEGSSNIMCTFTEGGLTMTSQLVVIVTSDSISIDKTSQTLTADGGTVTVTVTSSSDFTVSSSVDWIILDKTNGSSGDSISITISPHSNTSSGRSSTVIFTCGTKEAILNIYQQAAESVSDEVIEDYIGSVVCDTCGFSGVVNSPNRWSCNVVFTNIPPSEWVGAYVYFDAYDASDTIINHPAGEGSHWAFIIPTITTYPYAYEITSGIYSSLNGTASRPVDHIKIVNTYNDSQTPPKYSGRSISVSNV